MVTYGSERPQQSIKIILIIIITIRFIILITMITKMYLTLLVNGRMANRGLSGQTPPQTDKLRYQW